MNINKKSYILLVIIAILLILNVFSLYIVFNTSSIFGIGHYQIKENKEIEYGTNNVNINFLIDLRFNNEIERYEGKFSIYLTSYQTNEMLGFSNVDYIIWVNNKATHSDKRDFEIPKELYFSEFLAKINKYDNFSVTGFITILVNISGEIEEIQSGIDINFIMETSTWQYFYEFKIGSIWIEILLIISFFVLIFFFVRKIRYIYIKKKQSLDEKIRDEAFFEYLEKRSRKRKEE